MQTDGFASSLKWVSLETAKKRAPSQLCHQEPGCLEFGLVSFLLLFMIPLGSAGHEIGAPVYRISVGG